MGKKVNLNKKTREDRTEYDVDTEDPLSTGRNSRSERWGSLLSLGIELVSRGGFYQLHTIRVLQLLGLLYVTEGEGCYGDPGSVGKKNDRR